MPRGLRMAAARRPGHSPTGGAAERTQPDPPHGAGCDAQSLGEEGDDELFSDLPVGRPSSDQADDLPLAGGASRSSGTMVLDHEPAAPRRPRRRPHADLRRGRDPRDGVQSPPACGPPVSTTLDVDSDAKAGNEVGIKRPGERCHVRTTTRTDLVVRRAPYPCRGHQPTRRRLGVPVG
jgi:hypothetical protein